MNSLKTGLLVLSILSSTVFLLFIVWLGGVDFLRTYLELSYIDANKCMVALAGAIFLCFVAWVLGENIHESQRVSKKTRKRK